MTTKPFYKVDETDPLSRLASRIQEWEMRREQIANEIAKKLAETAELGICIDMMTRKLETQQKQTPIQIIT